MLRDSVEAQGAQGMNIWEFHPLWQCRCANNHHCHGSMDAQLVKHTRRILYTIKNYNYSSTGQNQKLLTNPFCQSNQDFTTNY